MAEKKTRRLGARTVQSFWASLMENDGADMKDRLKASEFLAKSMDLFQPPTDKSRDSGDVATDDVEITVNYGEDKS